MLLDSLGDASKKVQVLVASHSPDLLDDKDLDVDSILAVSASGGATTIAPVNEAGRSAVRDKLYTPGELLRLNQLSPDKRAARKASRQQVSLFDDDVD